MCSCLFKVKQTRSSEQYRAVDKRALKTSLLLHLNQIIYCPDFEWYELEDLKTILKVPDSNCSC